MFIRATNICFAGQCPACKPGRQSAMKKTFFLITLLLILPAGITAQTLTRERRTADNQSANVESAGVRNRVVNSKSNHAESQKLRKEAQAPAVTEKESPRDVTWGNVAVIIRPTGNTQIAAGQQVASVNRPTADEQQRARTLVQPTSLVTESRASKTARTLPPARPTAATAAYNVGVGDVLDIRLENLPTRESTLFTVLQNGTVEYPLLNSPITVAGLTADEIAYLLSNEIKVIESANVSVSVRDYASHTVVVTGAVDSPGRKVLRREAMPLYAVLAEALIRPEATSAIIVRNGKEATALPLNNEQAMAALIQAGDVIKINGANTTGKLFLYVGGEVTSPGEKSFRDGMTLTQALLAAGGVSRSGKAVVKIARRGTNGFLSTNEYSLRAIQEGKSPDPTVQAGDRIEVTSAM